MWIIENHSKSQIELARRSLAMGLIHRFNNCTQQLIYTFWELSTFPRASAMKSRKELRSTHWNLNQLLEVFQFAVAAVEDFNTQLFLDNIHAILNGLVIFNVFKEFEVEGDNLALDYFYVTLLGKKEHKERLI